MSFQIAPAEDLAQGNQLTSFATKSASSDISASAVARVDSVNRESSIQVSLANRVREGNDPWQQIYGFSGHVRRQYRFGGVRTGEFTSSANGFGLRALSIPPSIQNASVKRRFPFSFQKDSSFTLGGIVTIRIAAFLDLIMEVDTSIGFSSHALGPVGIRGSCRGALTGDLVISGGNLLVDITGDGSFRLSDSRLDMDTATDFRRVTGHVRYRGETIFIHAQARFKVTTAGAFVAFFTLGGTIAAIAAAVAELNHGLHESLPAEDRFLYHRGPTRWYEASELGFTLAPRLSDTQSGPRQRRAPRESSRNTGEQLPLIQDGK
jgi:hypothetical protein